MDEIGDNLESLGRQIDELDKQLIEILAARMRVVAEIGRYKKEHNMPVCRPEVETSRIKQARGVAECEGVDPDFIEALLYKVFEQSRKAQESAA